MQMCRLNQIKMTTKNDSYLYTIEIKYLEVYDWIDWKLKDRERGRYGHTIA